MNDREGIDFDSIVDALCNLDNFDTFASQIAMPNSDMRDALNLSLTMQIFLERDIRDEDVYDLISAARSCPDTYDALARAIGIRLMTKDSTITEPMRYWLTGTLTGDFSRPKSKGGPNRLVGATKRIWVATLVYEAVKMGLDPTRSPASEPKSAADAVVAALGRYGYYTTYDAVAKSWSTHAQYWMRDRLD